MVIKGHSLDTLFIVAYDCNTPKMTRNIFFSNSNENLIFNNNVRFDDS